MQPYAVFDRGHLPLITIYFTGEKENDENFQAYLKELENNYDRKEPFALIFELTNAPLSKMKYQLQQAEWMKNNKEKIQTYCHGVAYIIPGALMRNVLKFIFSVQKNPVPFKVFSTLEEGEVWAKAISDKAMN
ncbi:MAG: STAS/SEC14 domain-containing protein [Bacteroidota bacterium]